MRKRCVHVGGPPAAAAGNRTLVKWSSTFDADGAPDEQAKQAILGIYDAGLRRLEAIFRE